MPGIVLSLSVVLGVPSSHLEAFLYFSEPWQLDNDKGRWAHRRVMQRWCRIRFYLEKVYSESFVTASLRS